MYKHLSIPCDLSRTSLQDAALEVGPAFVYELHVHRMQLWNARNLVRQHTTETMTNPFAPVINVMLSTHVKHTEWVLYANGEACGSPGVE